MPNITSKSKKRERSESPRSVASNTSSISEMTEEILKNPKNQPIATNFKIMSNEVAGFKPYKVQRIYREFKKSSKTGGKKNKRITIKKKKARKTLKKPIFKRNK
tara:strand:+ start:492 stop:803 length:312 start_codon:yes stop_codon:yes gene_type:complete